MPTLNFEIQATSAADGVTKATTIATSFFGSMTGVDLQVGNAQPITPVTYNADGTVAAWKIPVVAVK